MFDLMNEIPELVYVSDLENYDLLLVNTAGRETFHLKDSQGLKCYQALPGRDAPCPFCTNARLNTETMELKNFFIVSRLELSGNV